MSKMIPTKPAKINFKNIKKYIQGKTRSLLLKLSTNKYINRYVGDLKLLPSHKVEQYKWRLTVMNPECLSNGKCVVCGCETPYLQMADEACDGKCYPEFMNKKDWEEYKLKNQIKL